MRQGIQAAGNPYVMVKHGRREDRAGVYDRFIAAAAAFYLDAALTPAGTGELLAARMAVQLRAPKAVREAAETLFRHIVTVGSKEPEELLSRPTGGTMKVRKGSFMDPARRTQDPAADSDNQPAGANETRKPHSLLDEEPVMLRVPGEWDRDGEVWFTFDLGRVMTDSAGLLRALTEFAEVARLDVTARWYHSLLTPWGKRRWLGRS
ncbi:hypothetical protein ACFVQ9_04565 [Streptomyces goshikiensis]|uniref:hypothetical protein n=1 Tax=Streptomyces goshikiensis TaxID=1942 RepID=UPI003685A02B